MKVRLALVVVVVCAWILARQLIPFPAATPGVRDAAAQGGPPCTAGSGFACLDFCDGSCDENCTCRGRGFCVGTLGLNCGGTCAPSDAGAPQACVPASHSPGTGACRCIEASALTSCPQPSGNDVCQLDGFDNVALGAATLALVDDGAGRMLRVDNIGSSGLDGVAQPVPKSFYMKTGLATPNFSLSRPGTQVVTKQIGVVEGVPGQLFSTMTIRNTGTQLELNGDWSAIGTTSYGVHITSGGATAFYAVDLNMGIVHVPPTDIDDMSCTVTPTPTCGNGVREAGEECDGADNSACLFHFCRSDCTCFNFVTFAYCGNGKRELFEECDGADAASCPGQCQPNCKCPTTACGNGTCDPGEECGDCPTLCGVGQSCVDCKCTGGGVVDGGDGTVGLEMAVRFAGPTSITVPGRGAFTGDMVGVFAANFTRRPEAQEQIVMTAANTGPIVLSSEETSPDPVLPLADTLTRDETKCQYAASQALAVLEQGISNCVVKCDKNAQKGKNPEQDCMAPYAGDTLACVEKVRGKAQALIDKKCAPDCPECYNDGECGTQRSNVAGAADSSVDAFLSILLCNDSMSGDGLSADEAKCRQIAAKELGKARAASAKCYKSCRKRERAGKTPAGSCQAEAVTEQKTIDCLAKAKLKAQNKIDRKCADAPECFAEVVGTLASQVTDAGSGRSLDPVIFCGAVP